MAEASAYLSLHVQTLTSMNRSTRHGLTEIVFATGDENEKYESDQFSDGRGRNNHCQQSRSKLVGFGNLADQNEGRKEQFLVPKALCQRVFDTVASAVLCRRSVNL